MDVLVADAEAELAIAARDGDTRAFDSLFRRWYAPVFSVCLRMVNVEAEAHDLAQETFLRVMKSWDRYDPDRPFARWILKIATHLAIDSIRRRRPEPLSGDDEPLSESAPLPDVDPERLRAAVAALPASLRAVVVLNLQQGWSHDEVAEALAITPNLARVRLFRALRMIREELA